MSSHRRSVRRVIVSLLTGVLTVSTAWAGIGLAPVANDLVEGVTAGEGLAGSAGSADAAGASAAAAVPGPGQFLVGAAKVSIEPNPTKFGGTWEKSGCATLEEDAGLETLTHVPDFRIAWPEKPNCLYMGGYGIGPMNPITGWDKTYGLWVRALVISDGTHELVLAVIDGTSYFGEYNKMCKNCGADDLARDIGAKWGIDPAGFMIASTHSHTAPDFIGGWGGVPRWYNQQVVQAFHAAVGGAMSRLQPAYIGAGEVLDRRFNGERRDFYRSAEDNTISWLRAVSAADGSTIATLGAFAAHPVTADEGAGIANADFPGPFNKRLEERFGGVGLFFQTGLGNMSPRGSTEEMGNGLAALIPTVGTRVVGNAVSVKKTYWVQPTTNLPLGSLGAGGFFDRKFTPGPAIVQEGKHADLRKCRSVSALGVNTSVAAARVGNLRFTGAPGETFSNLANTIEEKSPWVAFPLAQVNDGLGYIMQEFETDHVGRQGVGFVGDPLAEYEDAYSIDHCFGDAVLEKTLAIL